MTQQILVVGGGIGGLAAALAAARAACEVRLFERAPAFAEVGAGIQLGPNGVRCLAHWGLSSALTQVAAFPECLQVRCALSGRELARMALGQEVIQRHGAAYATVHRADLHALLLDAIQAQEGVRLNLAQPISGFREADGVVTLQTTKGKQIEGDALVGADGLWSVVRSVLSPRAMPRFTGHLAYRALVPQKSLPLALRSSQVTIWLGPRLHVVHYPVQGGDALNVVALIEGPEPVDVRSWDQEAPWVQLQTVMAGMTADLQDRLAAVTDAGAQWRLWPLNALSPLRRPEDMAQGRVALLGDAAHPMLPYLAQGATMALEDALALGQALRLDAVELPLRLRRYALNRWQRNAKVQARAQRNAVIFHAQGPLRWGRDAALRVLGERLLDQPWLYQAPDTV